MRSETDRYCKSGKSAMLGAPIKVTKSKKNCPGSIFTLGTDFKTREWAPFRLDDVDALPHPHASSNDIGISKTMISREPPKQQDLVIPTNMSVKVMDECKIPFAKIPMKLADSPPKEQTDKIIEDKIEKQDSVISSSRSVNSQSISSQSTQSIFGRRNPVESYSFKGTKLHKNRLKSLINTSLQHSANLRVLDDDTLSLHSSESKITHQQSKETLIDPLFKSSQESSEINTDWPAHQIHSRMMGWKLTSPDRRRELLNMLETVNLSTASMTEEEIRQHQKAIDDKDLKRIRQIAKRQAEAYKQSVSRLALHQNKEFKFSKNQLDKVKTKVKKLNDDQFSNTIDKVTRPCEKKLDAFKYDSNDPFVNVDIKRVFTAEVATEVKKRQDAMTTKKQKNRDPEPESDVEAMLCPILGVTSPGQRNVRTPSFQTVGRDQRNLLNPAERMELLSNAQDVEKTVAHQAADNETSKLHQINFIGSGSPKRGMTGEAYLLSVAVGGKSKKKPVSIQTGDWIR